MLCSNIAARAPAFTSTFQVGRSWAESRWQEVQERPLCSLVKACFPQRPTCNIHLQLIGQSWVIPRSREAGQPVEPEPRNERPCPQMSPCPLLLGDRELLGWKSWTVCRTEPCSLFLSSRSWQEVTEPWDPHGTVHLWSGAQVCLSHSPVASGEAQAGGAPLQATRPVPTCFLGGQAVWPAL